MRTRLLDALFVGVLILYVLAGVTVAPYHGDESTIIHKGQDVYFLLQGKLSLLLYSPSPGDQQVEQELRLINGVTSEYGIGIAAVLTGFTLKDIPQQWLWGADWNFNLQNGHMPSNQLLFVSRMSSALMLIVSIALIFLATKLIAGRGAAYFATSIYTLIPAVLLDGRRAMFEGATLLAIALVLVAGVVLARHIQQPSWRYWLLLGLAAGFGIASKHTLVVTIAPVFLALIFLGRRKLGRTILASAGAGILALAIFLLLNPTWWSAPLVVPREVIRLRSSMLSDQTTYYGPYANAGERLNALITYVMAPPQYYEFKTGWQDYIGGQIAAYEASGLQGLGWGTAFVVIMLIVSIVAWLLPGMPRPRGRPLLLFTVVFVFSLVVIYAATDIHWQRYYLPLAALYAMFYGLSLDLILRRLWRRSHAG